MARTCVKILKENGQVQYTSPYRAVSDDEMVNDDGKSNGSSLISLLERSWASRLMTLEDLQSRRMVPLPNMDSVRLTSRGRMCIS